nr:MAG TPA: hypothetical protein [Caudoviricetes sp.]
MHLRSRDRPITPKISTSSPKCADDTLECINA